MSGARWVKETVDLPRDPGLRSVPLAVRYTFECLFKLARRRDPLLGALARGDGRPFSIRYLARYVGAPHPTFLDHRSVLERAHLLEQRELELWYVPLVLLVEAETTTKRSPAPAATSPEHTLRLFDPTGSGGRPADRNGRPTDQSGRPTDHRLPQKGESDRDETYSASSSIPSPQELTPELALSLVEDLGHDASYLLEKLAGQRRSWLLCLVSPSERAQLTTLRRLHGPAFLSALRQALDDPTKIRRPGAWLRRTVPAIAGELSTANPREGVDLQGRG